MGETYGPGGSSTDAVEGVDEEDLERPEKDRREVEVAREAIGEDPRHPAVEETPPEGKAAAEDDAEAG
ncbi:hypothetical protein ABT381_27045 [Streptomyces sp. NPDC000151]|uniref:hypothetical protein n=1 Tax=Streptomyces sp. NPDC000151 TaxID=3154244 RepID=UPI0033342402